MKHDPNRWPFDPEDEEILHDMGFRRCPNTVGYYVHDYILVDGGSIDLSACNLQGVIAAIYNKGFLAGQVSKAEEIKRVLYL